MLVIFTVKQKNPNPFSLIDHNEPACSSPDWTSATRSSRRLVSTCSDSVNSLSGNLKAVEKDFPAHYTNSNVHLLEPPRSRKLYDRLEVEGSGFLSGEGGGSSTASTSASLQKDFDGEGFKEDVDSIVDTIDFMRRDILLTTTVTTMTIITTSDWKPRDSMKTASTRKLEREMSTRSSKVQSGMWDSSCDEIISDIFDRIYSIKRPCSEVK